MFEFEFQNFQFLKIDFFRSKTELDFPKTNLKTLQHDFIVTLAFPTGDFADTPLQRSFGSKDFARLSNTSYF
tara:strand:- start:56 stop:271 length:216 start_codon:yes stop_codon:yes gene_type:complete